MRVLFLDAYFEPEQTAFTHLENDLLEGLVSAGHEVEIVCPTPTRGVTKGRIKEYKKRKSEVLYDGHVHVTRFSSPQERKNPFLRALRYFWCNLRTYQIGVRVKNIDVVFANSTPPTQGLIAGKVAKKQKVPFVYSLQDIFPDSLVNAGMTREGALIWRIGKVIENLTYKEASRIITISDSFKDNLAKKNVDTDKIIVIPNWIDTSQVYDVARLDNKIIKKYGLDPNKFFITYSGNIGHSQNLELLVEVAKDISMQTKQIEFVIIGEGAAKCRLEEMIKENRLSSVHLLPLQPYEDIAHVFSLGDAGLIISKPGVGGSSVPSKTWSIMAAKRPVVASFDESSELVRLIKEKDCGYYANAGDKKELVCAIKELFECREKSKQKGCNGLKYVSEYIGKKKCLDLYISTLSKINECSN